MSDQEKQDQLEAKLSVILSTKIGRKVIFAEEFKIIKVPLEKNLDGTSVGEIDLILLPKDPELHCLAVDLTYLIKAYGEAMGITEESVAKKQIIKEQKDYVR